MIERMQVLGFTPTDLSRMSNAKLHDAYLEVRPLLEKKSAELQEVVRRERNRGQRLKAEIAGEQINRRSIEQYHNWSQSNLPKPIVARRADICGESHPQNPDVEFVSRELRAAQTELRRAEREVVRIGGEERISKVKQARMKVQVWEQQMQEVSK